MGKNEKKIRIILVARGENSSLTKGEKLLRGAELTVSPQEAKAAVATKRWKEIGEVASIATPEDDAGQ
jgi:hypothetical protein